MLNIPVYLRGSTYYLHIRIGNKQFKKSLDTGKKKIAKIRAIHLLGQLMAKQPFDINSINLKETKSFEIDLQRGILKSDGPEDHQRMMEALGVLKSIHKAPKTEEQDLKPTATKKQGLTVPQVVDKLFLLKKDLKEATRISYGNTAKEFSTFLKNPLVFEVQPSDITRYQEYLAEEIKVPGKEKKANSTRTIDNKISALRTIFNFAITQGYSNGANPAQNRQLMSSKKRKQSNGYAIFELDEIKSLYHSDYFKEQKQKDPDYYWVLMLGIHTGCRISEITGLKATQFKKTDSGVNYIQIRDSKTSAGIRSVPIPDELLQSGLADFIKDKDQLFKYTLRLGRGSGNAVGKKFKRHLETVGITRDKLVFHSIRKFVNDFLKQNGIPYEVRCQFIGHEIEDINNRVYAKDFNVEQIALALDLLKKEWQIISGLSVKG
ncbi:tyrosine-type recombinase/integrase [beta proteobacterium MWH-UniP1]